MQQAVLGQNDTSQKGSLRGNPYHLLTRSNIKNQNPPESGGTHLSQMVLTGQQHCTSHPLRNIGRNSSRGSGYPPSNG